jgi:L-2-hydroxyglutarate oxidase
MFHFAQEHGLSCKKLGKVIIANSEQDISTLTLLLKNAAQNKIKAEYLDEKAIKEIEPYANPMQFGIYTPDTACVDSKQILEKIREIITSREVKFYFGEEVISIDKNAKHVKTPNEKISYGYLFNSAGAHTDKIAKMMGLAKDYMLLPFKGMYYKLSKEKNHWVKGNIYPAPNLNLPFLGVHFTRTMNGEVYVGPTAIPALGRENYALAKGMSLEAFRILKDITMMYLANQQNFRMLMHSEIKKYSKYYFTQAAQKLVSSIKAADLLPSNKVGIRPQLINLAKRTIEMDFIIEQESHSMHVLNAISPAFTSAFSFAELLVNRMYTVYK